MHKICSCKVNTIIYINNFLILSGEEEMEGKVMEGVASIALLENGSISGHFVHLPHSICYGLHGTGIITQFVTNHISTFPHLECIGCYFFFVRNNTSTNLLDTCYLSRVAHEMKWLALSTDEG